MDLQKTNKNKSFDSSLRNYNTFLTLHPESITLLTVNLRKYCKDYGCVLIAPALEDDDQILQTEDGTGKYVLVNTDDLIGAKSKGKNSRCILGMGRKGKSSIEWIKESK